MQNRSQIGGVLTIISGAIGVINAVLFAGMIFFMRFLLSIPEYSGEIPDVRYAATMIGWTYGVIAFIFLSLGVLGIIGGIFSIKRRLWGLALAGAICGNLAFPLIGIPATVLVAMARGEFSSVKTGGSQVAATTTFQPDVRSGGTGSL